MIKITDQDLQALKALVREAGQIIMQVYASDDWATAEKADASPVTRADLLANQHLRQGLQQRFPDIPYMSEEERLPAWHERQHWSQYWLVDPLDGTREFLQRNGEFTVNLALIYQQRSRLGFVYAPAQDLFYWGNAEGAWLEHQGQIVSLHCRAPGSELLLLTSRRHSQHESEALAKMLVQHPEYQLRTEVLGSSLKICQIAAGQADLYLRLAPTSEWDTAAAQPILEAAGGRLLALPSAQPHAYNQQESPENPSFIALGLLDWEQDLLKALTST